MNNRYMSNNTDRNATWRVGVYCRLSKDDELTGESASISNQRDILVNYCQSQGWQVVDVFQDDGYTGLNTDRPDLQRLLKACEKGLVNLVITKDQSRLGRNHVQTGFLMEEFFPKHGVRYIALYDNVDTFDGDNEIVEQWQSTKCHIPALMGLAAAAVSLAILGPDNFILPAMLAICVMLVAMRGRLAKEVA